MAFNGSAVSSRAHDLSQLMIEFDTVQGEKRAAMTLFRERIKELRKRMRALSKIVHGREEQRSARTAQDLSQLMIEFDAVQKEERAAIMEFRERLRELRIRIRALSKKIRKSNQRRRVQFREHQEWNRQFGDSAQSQRGAPASAARSEVKPHVPERRGPAQSAVALNHKRTNIHRRDQHAI